MKSKILKRDYYTLNDNRTTYDFGFKKSLRIKPVSVNKKNTYNNYSSLGAHGTLNGLSERTIYSSKEKNRITLSQFNNICPGEGHCPNSTVIEHLKKKLNKLMNSNQQLTEINEFLASLITHKDGIYQQLLKENSKVKQVCKLLNSHFKNKKKEEDFNPYYTEDKRAKTEKKNKNKKLLKIPSVFSLNDEYDNAPQGDLIKNTEDNKRAFSLENENLIQKKENKKRATFSTNIPLSNKPDNTIIPKFRNKIHSLFLSTSPIFQMHQRETEGSEQSKFESNKSLNNYYNDDFDNEKSNLPMQHYAKLSALSQKNKYKTCSSNISFLAASPELLEQMISNPILKEIYNLSQQEDSFLETLNKTPKQKIYLFCDVIGSMIREYQDLIKLISRVKDFLKSSINLVDSVLLEDSTMVLINNTCNILNCERASLFIYDRFTDMLVLNTAEGLKKNEIKVPKDKGIVGSVFMTGEKLKIDDAYRDNRFNKEVDKKTNFKTRNILCYPLKDKDGDTFGAIQAINKANGPFDTDDLELMEIFSQQASAILKNMMNIDENATLISKMKVLLQFSNEIFPIKDKMHITLKCEEKLMLILFSTSAKIFFCNKQKNILEHYSEEGCEEIKPLGILGHVWKKKEIHGCSSVKTCKLYNNLVDLRASDSLITFPIINDIEVVAICQAIFPGKLSESSEKPKDAEMNILELFEKSFLVWYNINHKL